MREFMGPDFLLHTETARRLYEESAQSLPIIDYHCHLDPREIAENRRFSSIAQLWLGSDHYKWRAMRWNGIPEEQITGNAGEKEKFLAWAETVENCWGNPLYHWTHLELQRFFGITEPLTRRSAESIWTACNAKLRTMGARDMLRTANVEALCTTDDPVDSLEYHRQIAADPSISTRVLPTFRPDKGIYPARPTFLPWVLELERVSRIHIRSLEDFYQALRLRMDYFAARGCRFADHSIEQIHAAAFDAAQMERAFACAMGGETPAKADADAFTLGVLCFLGGEYARRGWIMQMHIGCCRNNNRDMLRRFGADGGFDGIDDGQYLPAVRAILDELYAARTLPRCILYNLNPKDSLALAVLAGCFQRAPYRGRVQFGPAWWFNDHLAGMGEQMTTLASVGILRHFVGMATDSRSFLSYPRHEYFRRILCDLYGQWLESGAVPFDLEEAKAAVEAISYGNIKGWMEREAAL